MRRDSFQVAITEVLEGHGRLASFERAMENGSEFHLRLDKENYLPLVIEVIGENRVAVTHYREQNGDLIQDPEIVFQAMAGRWWPIEITQVWGYRSKHIIKDGQRYVDTRFHDEVSSFANMWARNIRGQRWAGR